MNGYRFHTKSWSEGKKMDNSGVHVKGVTEGGEDDFYGIIQRIYELDYCGLNSKVPVFYCQWFDPRQPRGTRIYPQYNIVELKTSGRYNLYDPFILTQKARQVFYVNYPQTCRHMHGWCVAITTKPRGYVEVGDIEDEVPYQAEEIARIDPIEQVEQIQGLADPQGHYEEEEEYRSDGEDQYNEDNERDEDNQDDETDDDDDEDNINEDE